MAPQRVANPFRHPLAAVFSATLLILPVGCGRQSAAYRHEVLNGTVESADGATGQLTLRTAVPHQTGVQDQKVACLLTNDAEVYINGMFSGREAIRAGDSIELIGYRDPEPPAERFIVSLAHIGRRLPPPSEPDLTSPETAPAATVQEK
jgi:hypothetical protein